MIPRLGPDVGFVSERAALRPGDAELLAGRRGDDPPAADLLASLAAESLEARGLGVDVVALDVEVDAAGMVDALDHEQRLGGLGVERPVAVVGGVGRQDGAAEGLAPEIGGGGDVAGLAVD